LPNLLLPYEHGMKLSLLVSVAVFLAACNSPQRYESNRLAAQSWLDSNSGRPAADLSGKWRDATDEGWGEASLVQKAGRVSGTLGNYEVEGVVAGPRVNLALKTDNWYYYSVTAVSRGGVMEGYYAAEFPPKLIKGKSPAFRFERVR
jgi:hypothetical protein